MAQFAQSLRLDLTDALTGDVEFLAHFLQGTGTAVLQAKAKLQHVLLTGREGVQHFVELLAQQGVGCGLGRSGGIVIGNEVAQVAVFFLTDRRFQRHRVKSDLHDLSDLFGRHLHHLCDLLSRRISAVFLHQLS